MIAKTFEIRDAGTFIPILAIKLEPGNEADRFLLSRAGYGRTPDSQKEYVILCRINGGGGPAHSDPWEWGGSGMLQTAHRYILVEFDNLESGSVVCCEWIRGERTEPKKSESNNYAL